MAASENPCAAAVNAELQAGAAPPPLRVISGSVGSVVCEVPWTRLGSRSVKVTVRDLFLHEDLGTFLGEFVKGVSPSDVEMFIVTKAA